LDQPYFVTFSLCVTRPTGVSRAGLVLYFVILHG